MIAREETDTAAPLEIATLLRFRFALAVPTLISMPDPAVVRRAFAVTAAHAAVPVALALESCVIAFADLLPAEAAAKAVAFRVRSARRTWDVLTVSASVGCVPS